MNLIVPDNTPRPILNAQGSPIAGRIAPRNQGSWTHDPARPTNLDFARYAAWRRTKCKPRDLNNARERIEEVDQATHEFVGEVAEFGELVIQHEAELLLSGPGRDKLLDEIGDIFFCGLWVLDGWGFNPFLLDGAPGVDDFTQEGELAEAESIGARVAAARTEPIAEDERSAITEVLKGLALSQTTLAGLLCNAFKKQAWQGRKQSAEIQAARVVNVLAISVHVLTIAGFKASDALARNIEKLDARYPDGYAGPGGGNRTGKGA